MYAHQTATVSMQTESLRSTYRCTQLTPALGHLPIKEKEPRALCKEKARVSGAMRSKGFKTDQQSRQYDL